MKGLFVSSSIRPNQGWTDFGYYVDGDGRPDPDDGFSSMIENDEAYLVELFVNYREGVHIRLSSENRKVAAEVDEDIGFRKRGLESTLYQATGTPRLPSTYEDRDKSNQKLTAFAEYALEHGKGRGIDVENVDWENLLEDQSDL